MSSVAKSASACLDEHEVLAFVSGEIEEERRGEALEHVDECESCRLLVAALARGRSTGEQSDEEREDSLEVRAEPEEHAVFPEGELVDGRFRLTGALGRGATGTVHRALDEKLGVEVALKLLTGDGREGAGARAFARELKVGRRVTHPNVCRLHDAGAHRGVAYLTMELIEGETLAAMMSRERVSPARAVEILDGIASGLEAVHAEGIVHRDLKPANVMIERRSGRPILTDFGFAADLDSKQSWRLVGTPSFWAPERARGESPTPASDVYSFGILAYRLLAGREFSLSDPNAMSAVPRTHRAFVSRCLAPRPSDRYADAREMRVALRRCDRRPPVPWPIAAALGVAVVLVVVVAGARSERAPVSPRVEPAESALPPVSSSQPEAPPRSIEAQPDPAPAPILSKVEKKPSVAATKPRIAHSASVTSTTTASNPQARKTPPPEDDPLYRR